MVKNFLKNFIVFLMMFGLVFSNLPYDFLTGAVDGYLRSANIVDKFWHLKQDRNVVDNFNARSFFSGLKINSALAAVGDARIQYGQSTNATPKTRFYNDVTNAYNAQSNMVAGTANIGWVVSKESPTEDVTVVVTQSTTGRMDIFCRNSSGTWTKDISGVVVSANAANRRFDVEFEKTSGIPMVLYSTNAAGANELAYYRKTGAGCGAGSWTGPTNLNATVVTAAVLWVELEARQTSGSNVLAAAFSDATATQGGKLEAMIWNGSWGNESPAGAANGWSDLSAELLGTAGANTAKVFDLAFETLTGDLLIAWGTSLGANGTNGWRYATCAATLPCAWSAVQTPAGPTDDATNVACAADPGSDAIACAAQGNAGNDLTAWRWSGTGVSGTAANADTGCLAAAAGDMHVDIDWVVSGTQRMAVAVYANGNTGYNYIYYDTVGAAWRTNTNAGFTITGAPTTAGQSIQVVRNPSNAAQLLVSFTDSASDLWSKRLAYNGAGGGAAVALSTWSNSDGGVTLQGTVSSITAMPFSLDWINVYTQNLTINETAGSQYASRDSGATSQYAQDTSCNSAATCAAFTLAIDGGTETLTSIKITETGTADATNDLANVALFYDTDGNYANGVTGQFGSTVGAFTSETATISGSLAMAAATTYYFYVRYDLAETASYPKGGQTVNFQIAANGDVTTSGSSVKSGAPATLVGSTTVLPNATGTTYGAGLGDGGRSGESITITGYGFGAAPVGSRGNCSGAVDTGCVRFIVGGNATVVTGDVTAWSNTSVTYTINSALASNGGVSAVELVAGSQADASDLTFYVYPNITGLTTCSAGGDRDSSCGTNASPEYSAGDTYGLVMLNGDHFSTTAGTVQFTGAFGTISGTVHATAEGACSVGGWGSTGTGNTVCLEVSSAISNSVYDGTITLNRNGDAKTDANDLHILPRITSNDPVSGVVGDTVAIDGDHFCQTGTCPSTPPSSDYVVYFGSTQALTADFVTTCLGGDDWSHTQVCVKVPVGTPAGLQRTKIQGRLSPLYESQREAFTVQSLTPDTPSNLEQSRNSGFTNLISVGGYVSSTPVYFRFDTSVSLGGGTLYPQIEIRPVLGANKDFVSTCVPGTYCEEGSGIVYAGGTETLTISTSTPDNSYHWQARARYNRGGSDYYSAWQSYPVSGNPEADIDLIVDTTGPVITFTPTDNCAGGQSGLGANGVTINWTLNESGDGQLVYSKNSDLSSSINFPVPPQASGFSHSVSLSNLDSGTTYYYKVKSRDAAHNVGQRPPSSPYCSFITSSVNAPAKTTSFYIMGATDAISALATTSFSVIAPETSPAVKSAFIEVTGLVSGGTNPIVIQANGVDSRSYAINATAPSLFKFIYQISFPDTETNLNLNDAAPALTGI